MPKEPAAAAVTNAKAAETLSQFVARVLDQLSLSAWLPSGALVLGTTFLSSLASVVARTRKPAIEQLGAAFSTMGEIRLGGAVLLFSAVIVLTILTQAFSFESIRIMEGYWGTSRLAELLAKARTRRMTTRRKRLERQIQAARKVAWGRAAEILAELHRNAVTLGGDSPWTPNVLAAIGSEVQGLDVVTPLTDEEEAAVAETDWREHAEPDSARRLLNLERRLADYPRDARMMPTRLGNILRHYEDEIQLGDVESYIQRNFDDFPISMKIDHDEQRTRLDLYCSMVLICASLGVLGIGVFAVIAPWWIVSVIGVTSILAWMMYRAAIASARAYGVIVLNVKDYLESQRPEPPHPRGLQRLFRYLRRD